MPLGYTYHAMERAEARGIRPEHVRSVLKDPMYTFDIPDGKKGVIGMIGDRELVVVVAREGFQVITTYWVNQGV